MFDVKNPALRAALADAPKIGESLCDCLPRALRRGPRRSSTAVGVPYTLDPTLVRGLDYYTRTTFEFVGPEENANSTICGGGRYDGLVEALGGPPTPGIGFGAGIERLLLAIERRAARLRRAGPRRLLRARRRPAGVRARDMAERSAACGSRLLTATTPAAR